MKFQNELDISDIDATLKLIKVDKSVPAVDTYKGGLS